MTKYTLIAALILGLISPVSASKREREDEDSFERALIAATEQAEREHKLRKPEIEEEGYSEEFFSQIDALVAQHSGQADTHLQAIVETGTLMKLMANVYRGRQVENSNIFLPFYTLKIRTPDGRIETQQGYFKTHKDQICIFASGGNRNRWEKTVTRVFNTFFQQNVKLVRAHWINKHLRQKGVREFHPDDYKDRQTELHSELYYDLFFRHFFLPTLRGKTIESLHIDAYSWWEVCDMCEQRFTHHRNILQQNGVNNFSVVIQASRPYAHEHSDDLVQNAIIEDDNEDAAWQRIWSGLQDYVRLHADDEEAKHTFWTEDPTGLELCKWIGQAFVENKYLLDGRFCEEEAGDLLPLFQGLGNLQEQQAFYGLIGYLSDVNNELSCWFRGKYINRYQYNWKAYNQQIVMPHFGWEVINEHQLEEGTTECEICGHKNIRNVFVVYHPKHDISSKGKQKCLQVGSECVEIMTLDQDFVRQWRQENPHDQQEQAALERAQLLGCYQALDMIEAENIYKVMKKEAEGNNGIATLTYIKKNTIHETAKDMEPFFKILMINGLIEKAGRGQYKVLD